MWPIQLPYGLSEYHRHARNTGKVIVAPCEERPRWQVLTLKQISCSSSTTNTWPDPCPSNSSNSSQSKNQNKSRKRRHTSPHKHEMGVAGPASRHSKNAPVTTGHKRRKTSKPQSRCIAADHSALAPAAVQKKRRRIRGRKPLGPVTRPGTHQNLPINVDSDDETASVSSANIRQLPIVIDSDDEFDCVLSSATQRRSVVIDSDDETGVTMLEMGASAALSLPAATKVGLPHNIRPGSSTSSSPVSSHRQVKTPRPFALPLYPARRHNSTPFEERLVSVEPLGLRPRHTQDTSTPSLSVIRPRRATAQEILPSPASSYADDGIQLTLADIEDFSTRQKTAQLMAVAPGLPVADLYHLLMERKGHFEAAKQDVVRQSQKPSTLSPTRKRTALARAATALLTTAVGIQEQVKDETYIKIDCDDPDFMFDNDAPAEPSKELERQNRRSQARPKKSAPKSTAKPKKIATRTARRSSPVGGTSRSCSSSPPATDKIPSASTPTPRTPGNALTQRKGCAVKAPKGKGAGDVNRGLRATSYDLEFIVSDDEILEDSDETYTMSDNGGTVDVDMTDDGTDLCIDMEPEYSYNSVNLSSPSSE